MLKIATEGTHGTKDSATSVPDPYGLGEVFCSFPRGDLLDLVLHTRQEGLPKSDIWLANCLRNYTGPTNSILSVKLQGNSQVYVDSHISLYLLLLV